MFIKLIIDCLHYPDYKRDRRQNSRPWDNYDGHTKRYSAVYNQQLGSLGFIDQAEFNWMFFRHESRRDFHVGMSKVAGQSWNPSLPADIVQNSPRDFKVWGTEPRLSMNIDGDSVNQQWIVGGRFVSEKIDYQVRQKTLATATTAVTRDWSFDDQAWAGYISNAAKLFNDTLTITPGMRFEHVNGKYTDQKSGQHFSSPDDQWLPGLTAGYQLAPEWFLYADMQKSLRPAQVTQIVKGGDVSSELAWNYDSVSDSYVNIGRTRHQGVELEGFWSPEAVEGLKLHAGYAYLQAEQCNGQNTGKEVPYASRNQVTLESSYDWRDNTFTVAGYYFSKSYSDAANTREENSNGSVGQLPSYWVWNAQVSRDLYKSGDTVLNGYVGVNNLFNRDYWYRGIDTSPWGRQPAPGRSVTAGLSMKF